MNLTENQIQRLKNDWVKIAKDALLVEYTNGTLYAYGTEVATLRLYKAYNVMVKNENARQDFSKNFNTHFFALDI